MSQSLSANIIALACANVSKVFPVYNDGKSWRILFGSKSHRKEIAALSDISLTVPKGKFVGVLGHNGAGKSTLLRVLGGAYEPTTGKITTNGSLSGLFELGGLGNRYITGRQCAKRILQLQGVKANQLKELIEDIREFSELSESFDQPIYTYSSGMAARLYFSAATALQHDIYLIDEVLSVGDEHFSAKCWQRLREKFAYGASGILVTHDWAAVLKICEEAHIVKQGRIIKSGKADQIVQIYLDLPLPNKQHAYFAEENPLQYVVQSGDNIELFFDVVVKEDILIEFNYSIEWLRLGIGWEIILLSPEWFAVAKKAGVYTVSIKIPKLPLAQGKYSLNLFLASNVDKKMQGRVGCDAKTWTTGNAIELIVEGEATSAVVRLPFIWHKGAA